MISDRKSREACRTVVLHHSTTSPTTLLGCWAKFRTGLPPYRSGLVDGKCVWRLSRRVSLTPLCIACLDLTSTTSGRTMWPTGAVTGLQHPHLRPTFFFFFNQFFPFIQACNQKAQISETEGKRQRWSPAPRTHGCIKARFNPANTSSLWQKKNSVIWV